MTESIATEIQTEQERGRAKYGSGPNDLAHDDEHRPEDWAQCIHVHNTKAFHALTPEERRKHYLKAAGLAVSAIEAMDRASK